MSVEDALERAADLQRRAKAYSRREHYDRAVAFLTQAIDLLEPALEQQRAQTEASSTSLVATALADTHGVLGGTHRRQGRLDEALREYSAGREIEQDPEFGIVNSYNLTNEQVIAFLLAPQPDEQQRAAAKAAYELVWAQANGPRRGDWWAWADVGVLSVLAGERDDAENAYRTFLRLGARPTDLESAQLVLDEIVSHAREHDPEVMRCAEATVALLGELRQPPR
ncbi:hypothetical protein OM076_18285 [Solirubrobacter ginsenosidimutans]|uniref:Tetratricopeptide repeat protein n=1 Tax=Solirubrobacter ginsenosidimutans TaxID=490573 RepID=A0A9X3S2F4_9ACTN|nr:hypothetical protein [Solirubrobacter ginsenosidimutans]MDA0162227.1 hypothetical protein [Solirubrobacter ginsenosidimutans]